MAANKAVRWAVGNEGNAPPSANGTAPKKSSMKRNKSEDDVLHSSAAAAGAAASTVTGGSPSGSSDGDGAANRLRGYLEVKHNPASGKGRSRLLGKVRELAEWGNQVSIAIYKGFHPSLPPSSMSSKADYAVPVSAHMRLSRSVRVRRRRRPRSAAVKRDIARES